MSSDGRFDTLYLWYLGDPAKPVPVGTLHAIDGGRSVSLRYAANWLSSGFPLSEDLPLVDIEHFSTRKHDLAARAGIRVAETRILALPGEHALLVRRFDRIGQQRIHCLSAATVLHAAEGELAELSYPNLAQLLRRRGDTAQQANQQDMAELFRRMVFNILIDNTDDHEKNHAVMVQTTANSAGFDRATLFRLAPAYDVLPTNFGQGRQEFTVGDEGYDSTLSNAMSQCARFGLRPPEAAALVVQVIGVVNGWQAHFRALQVSEADIASLAAWLDGEPLLSQRTGFDPTAYGTKRGGRRKTVFGG